MAAPTSPPHETDEWEVVNDDGFVYKRKKRRVDPVTLTRPPDPTPDPETEERDKRKRKRQILLKIKEKYEREVGLWENLSNTLWALEESAKSQLDGSSMEGEIERVIDDVDVVVSEETGSGSFAAHLLVQVEAQEVLIQNCSRLCDAAESLCDALEEKTTQSFLDLPIWGSPNELMASLCEDC